MRTALLVLVALLVLYAVAVLALLAAGRRTDARALAGFVPDCLVLFRRLLADPAVPRRRKWALGLTVAYLAMPFDLIPDFIPVAGQLDDAILVGLVLRGLVRGGGPGLVRLHWPGPEPSLRIVLRLSGARVS
jgi:uncharacterized membrane protein YkvA (DUF1232 family)